MVQLNQSPENSLLLSKSEFDDSLKPWGETKQDLIKLDDPKREYYKPLLTPYSVDGQKNWREIPGIPYEGEIDAGYANRFDQVEDWTRKLVEAAPWGMKVAEAIKNKGHDLFGVGPVYARNVTPSK